LFGGLGTGLLTVTETASLAAIVSAIYCCVIQGLNTFIRSLVNAARGTLAAMGTVFMVIIGAAIISRLLAVTGAAQWLSIHLTDVSSNSVLFFTLLVLLYVFLGMIMD